MQELLPNSSINWADCCRRSWKKNIYKREDALPTKCIDSVEHSSGQKPVGKDQSATITCDWQLITARKTFRATQSLYIPPWKHLGLFCCLWQWLLEWSKSEQCSSDPKTQVQKGASGKRILSFSLSFLSLSFLSLSLSPCVCVCVHVYCHIFVPHVAQGLSGQTIFLSQLKSFI